MPQAMRSLVIAIAHWLNQHLEDLIDYLRKENRVLGNSSGTDLYG